MRKNDLKKLDVYYPVLFKLSDDSAIIHSTLHEYLRKSLSTIMIDDHQVFYPLDKSHEFHFQISQQLLKPFLDLDPSIQTIEGYLFYYHHRLIFYTPIVFTTEEPEFRHVRMAIISFFQELAGKVVSHMNHVIQESTKTFTQDPHYQAIVENKEDIMIKTFYSYCIVFQPKNNSFLKKNDQIQTFNIRTLQPKAMPINRTSLLRISIPNMTAYYNGKLSTEFKSEIINTVYKIVLYEKKLNELSITDAFESFDYEKTKKHQAISEQMIMDMWSYCLDVFGGKRTDQIGDKGALVGLIFSLIAFVFSIISLIQSIL